MSRKYHAEATTSPIVVDDVQVGLMTGVKFKKGAPDFGLCEWRDCEKLARRETLLGTQFCDKHFMQCFYGDDGKA